MTSPHSDDPPSAGMQRISRVDSWWSKRLLPLVTGGICLGAIVAMVSKDGLPWAQVAPILIVFGIAVAWASVHLHRQMADEVWDGGDRLLVRRGSRDTTVTMADIAKVECRGQRHSATLTLHLRDGGKILFCPRLNPPGSYYFASNLVADDLGRRVGSSNETAIGS